MAAAKSGTKQQTFFFNAPDAARVLLVGDFTQWQERAIPMKQRIDGRWQATVVLRAGRYHYRFIVDGDWRDDPDCSQREANPFGTEDAVRLVA